MAGSMPALRRTRFVCISDTHNASPQDGCFKLPPGDVLIHAGDLTNQGTFGELKKTIDWIAESDFEVKIVVAGNHDITLDEAFYTEHGHKFHDRYPQDWRACKEYVSTRTGITYLDHASARVRLSRPDSPRTTFKVFGSPYSPRSGLWAFGYEPKQVSGGLTDIWNTIPLDTDVVITHTPPRGHRDMGEDRSCAALRKTLWRTRPQLAVCGHIHAGWGAEDISWDLGQDNVDDTRGPVHIFEIDRTSKKLAKVDLTRKARERYSRPADSTIEGQALDENGSHRRLTASQLANSSSISETGTEPYLESMTSEVREKHRGKHDLRHRNVAADNWKQETEPSSHTGPSDPDSHSNSGRYNGLAVDEYPGRTQTCIVNAAIMRQREKMGRSSGSRYNKPIIVDLDLPVLDDSGAATA